MASKMTPPTTAGFLLISPRIPPGSTAGSDFNDIEIPVSRFAQELPEESTVAGHVVALLVGRLRFDMAVEIKHVDFHVAHMPAGCRHTKRGDGVAWQSPFAAV